MRANQCDNDFQLQMIAIFSDNGYHFQLKSFKKFKLLYTFKTLYGII